MNPPDEKAIAELNAAEQGRKPRGKWRVIFSVVLILLIILGSPILIIELHRQAKISEAEDDIIQEGELIKARFATVDDWPEWFRDRKPKNWGGDRFSAWTKNCEFAPEIKERHDELDTLLADAFHRAGDRPERQELEQFLSETAPAYESALALRRYDCLSLVPEFKDGMPDVNALEVLQPLRLLIMRSHAHALLGNYTEAWTGLNLSMQISLKLTHPSSLVEHMVAFGHEHWVHETARQLREWSTPPHQIAEDWASLPSLRDEITLELVEAELAWISLLFEDFENIEWDYLYMWGEDNRGWFAFLDPSLDWNERKESIENPANLARLTADWFRELREYADRLEAGGDPRDWRNENFDYFKDLVTRSFEIELRRESTELMAKLTLAQLDGAEPDVTGLATEYPHHEVLMHDGHWIARVKYTKAVTDNIEKTYETKAEFYEFFKPNRVPTQR